MGREIRRVPPNWSHPTEETSCGMDTSRFVPLHDQTHAEAMAEWEGRKALWDAGERPEDWTAGCTFDDWYGEAPDPDQYRSFTSDGATWFQVYETVSEGTPVTPPFATLDELVAHLADHGDEWDWECAEGGRQGATGWGLASAKAFCLAKWTPTAVIRDNEILTNPGEIAVAPRPR
ncbi:hypothetical protein [Methylorubrum populi]|jgi:hypothetical protein|uniref:hypothetical protein n=1 Tax=Methylorubrum populi TaxID=223967 RepID=UPI0012649CA1|nr:hypothetical protein [Methylorubrum populi]